MSQLSISADPTQAGGGEFPPEVLALAARLTKEATQKQIEPYVLNLRERSRYRFEKDKPALVEGKYRTYILVKGTHSRVEPEEQKRIDEINKSHAGAVNYTAVQPERVTYMPGKRLQPLTDNEALLMAQDPGKFRWVGEVVDEKQQSLDELQAELERMRMEARKTVAMEEELSKLKAENDKLRKKS